MKLREVNLQSLLNKLKTFSYTEVIDGTETTVNVSLYPDSQNEAMYLLFKQKVGNLKADDVLSDLIREEITDDDLANVIKTQCIERWKQLLKVWQADYNPLWNVDGTEVRVIETKYGKQIGLEKGTTVTNEQIEDGKSVTEQKTKAVSTDYVSPYDTPNAFNSAAKNETDAGKMEGTSSIGKVKLTNDGTDTTTESGSDTVTDTFTRGGNIGTVSTVKLIQEQITLWSSFNFFDIWFKDIASVIALPIYE